MATMTSSVAYERVPSPWKAMKLPMDIYRVLATKIHIDIDTMPYSRYHDDYPYWKGTITAEAEFDDNYTIIVDVDVRVKFERVVAPDMIYYEPVEVRPYWTDYHLFDQYGDERSCDFDLRYFISLITY